MIAAILESGELERVSTGLSLLVSAAADGRRAFGLASYGQLEAHALAPGAAPHVSPDARAVFARTLAELRDTALAMENVRIWACAAAVETTGADRAAVEARLAGVLSTPRFLREVAGAELVVL